MTGPAMFPDAHERAERAVLAAEDEGEHLASTVERLHVDVVRLARVVADDEGATAAPLTALNDLSTAYEAARRAWHVLADEGAERARRAVLDP